MKRCEGCRRGLRRERPINSSFYIHPDLSIWCIEREPLKPETVQPEAPWVWDGRP